mmetsp:Transcript_36224/g.58388  ORF Transcript_36224/g.58388 Transcript_36224/m.58388 type:complete len:267 (+) Transcript_36224:711-1511(+)
MWVLSTSLVLKDVSLENIAANGSHGLTRLRGVVTETVVPRDCKTTVYNLLRGTQSAKDDSMTHQHDMSGARTSSLTALGTHVLLGDRRQSTLALKIGQSKRRHQLLCWRHGIVCGHSRVPQISRCLTVAWSLPAAPRNTVGAVIIVVAIDRIGVALPALNSRTSNKAEFRSTRTLRTRRHRVRVIRRVHDVGIDWGRVRPHVRRRIIYGRAGFSEHIVVHAGVVELRSAGGRICERHASICHRVRVVGCVEGGGVDWGGVSPGLRR